MGYVMKPDRKRHLIKGLEKYLLGHFKGTTIFDRIPCVRDGESGAEIYKKVQERYEETRRQSQSDNDWDTLRHIFPTPPGSQRPSGRGGSGSPEEEGSTTPSALPSAVPTEKPSLSTIHDIIEASEQQETFTEALLRIISEKQLTEPEVYNSVFMDRKLFNKIRKTPEYQPSKRTALLLAVALKLDIKETKCFIGKAGFQLSHWNKFDVIVEYFIVTGNYDIMEINEILAEYKQPLLLRCD